MAKTESEQRARFEYEVACLTQALAEVVESADLEISVVACALSNLFAGVLVVCDGKTAIGEMTGQGLIGDDERFELFVKQARDAAASIRIAKAELGVKSEQTVN